MRNCANCVHVEVCKEFQRCFWGKNAIMPTELDFSGNGDCNYYKYCGYSVNVPFISEKGASPADKIAHTCHSYAVEGVRIARNMKKGYYVRYHEEKLFSIEKDNVVCLVFARNPNDAIKKAKQTFSGQKQGKWIDKTGRPKSTMFVCSVCGETAYDRPLGSAKHVGKKICKLKFCPNCGAEMCEKVNYENP